MSNATNSYCMYFRRTVKGQRCVLVSPEDWKRLGSRYLTFCKSKGMGCPTLAKLLNSLGDGSQFASTSEVGVFYNGKE